MRVFGWVVLIVIALIVLNVVGFALGWFGKAEDVVSHEIDPAVLQQKYEWFKDASATLDQPIPVKSITINLETKESQ